MVERHLGHRDPDATPDVPSSMPRTLALSLPAPNPFWRQLRFTLTLEERTAVDLSVRDVGGRRVTTIFRGELDRGMHEFAWGGKSGSGTAVASGVYFVCANTEGQREIRRTLFLGGR